MIGIKTVRQGERVAVWDFKGRVEYIDGPRRMILFRKTIESLRQYSAGADEYLSIEFVDGHCEHQRGPTSVWYDPVEHLAIKVMDSLELDSHEAIVVYRRSGEAVQRRVERGPMLFVPQENEWLHEFRWHGADPQTPTHKVPRALSFHKLRVIPDQTYYLVDDVRTSDDALLTVKLMIFFELSDIERMLDQTHDPIADFINAVTADVVDFAGTRSFEAFKQDTEQLNELESYQNLLSRANRIGYQINKVVYRGYTAGETLQAMHDSAIEARTRLKLDAETEIQAQELADVQLAREAIRAEKRQEMEARQTEHDIHLQRLQHDEEIHQQQEIQHVEEETRRRVNQIELEHQQAKNQEQSRYLGTMREMQIDLTRYLVAQYQNPDRLIRISGDKDPSLHLHEEG